MPPAPSTPTHPLLAIGLMLSAMAILPFLDVCAKFLGQQGMPVLQIVWARVFFGVFLTLPFALRIAGPKGLVPTMPGLHTLRAILLIGATGLFFMGLRHMPIADCVAIFFVQPLIVTVLSPLVLKETVGLHRWTAVLIGFIGTLIIIRPGFQEFNPGVLYALGSGMALAVYMLITRRIAGMADAMLTTFHTSLMGAIILSIAAFFFWSSVTPGQWVLLIVLALCANLGHYLIVRAYDFGEASMLAPLAYTEIIVSTILGWVFFSDFPDRWTFLGVGILIACAIYISLRERIRNIEPVRDFEQP